jgi:UDPglucose 6-dehydrogenase
MMSNWLQTISLVTTAPMLPVTAFTPDVSGRLSICCIGAGYVGGPTMAVIAQQCPDIDVYVVDLSQERIDAWNSDDCLPIYEPGLKETVLSCRGRNLFFTTDIGKCIFESQLIFVSVNTPTKKHGIGKGRAANLGPWESAGRMIAKFSEGRKKIVVEKSTVPVKTAEALMKVLNTCSSPKHTVSHSPVTTASTPRVPHDNQQFTILSNPEFLAEGSAIADLLAPDRVLIGGPSDLQGSQAVEILRWVYSHWISTDRIIVTNVWSSELSKLVANAFLAQRVSSINSIAMLCEKTDADVEEVAKAIGMDSRIGSKFIQASVGFGGSCFAKDILSLVYICDLYGIAEVGEYWQQVLKMNELRKCEFTKNIVKSMFNNLNNKKIAIFGFAFKKDTGDTRESPAVDVCFKLLEEGAILSVYDPKVEYKQALIEFEDHGIITPHASKFQFTTSPLEAVRGSHAIVVLTDWNEFKSYDYQAFKQLMEEPAFIFDGRNLLNHHELYKFGFEVHRIGKSPLI